MLVKLDVYKRTNPLTSADVRGFAEFFKLCFAYLRRPKDLTIAR
jgi:hypothetical protein